MSNSICVDHHHSETSQTGHRTPRQQQQQQNHPTTTIEVLPSGNNNINNNYNNNHHHGDNYNNEMATEVYVELHIVETSDLKEVVATAPIKITAERDLKNNKNNNNKKKPPLKKTKNEIPQKNYNWYYYSDNTETDNNNNNCKRFHDEISENLEKAYLQSSSTPPPLILNNIFNLGDQFTFDFKTFTFSSTNTNTTGTGTTTSLFKFERKSIETSTTTKSTNPTTAKKSGFSLSHFTDRLSDVFSKKKPQSVPLTSPVPHSLKESTEIQKSARPSIDIVSKTKIEDEFLENIRKTHPKPPPPFDFTILPLPIKRYEGGPNQLIYDQLHAQFLSPHSLTENDKDANIQIKEKKNDEVFQILKENVDNIESMFDRSGTTPVSQFIVSTYSHGLPLFKGNTSVNNHTIHAMKVIFDRITQYPAATRKSMLRKLSEAYTACQMEQGRVIDSIYGSITGRDKNLKAQVLTLVDLQKETVLNQLINHYNPEAWKTTDDNPSGQIPHIQSSYCIALSQRLGLRGIKAALLDKDSFQVHPTNTDVLTEAFKRMFSIQDLINTIITDVNQQDEGADRLIDIESLSKWAGDNTVNNGFDSYTIFYDEDKAEDWPKELGVPKPENQYKPFLNQKVTIQILQHLFLK